MASYTKNLNLLKKDPVADGADTFNITTMLNDNWDKIDAAKGQIDSALSNKVNAGAPQVYDLPLSSGWTNYGTSRSRYWRNQFGEVSVIVDISNDGAVQHPSVVAQLPTGFRPAENFDVPAVLYDGNNQTCLKCFVRAASGEIIVASSAQTTWPEATYFIAQLTFMASS